MPVVSVVMAAYNHGSYISFAIESVMSQSWTDWELIIVDDGSSDHTSDVVRPYLKDSRIAYCRQCNKGQASAKNIGIARSRGEYIAFLDADDVWYSDKLRQQLMLFDDPAVGVVHARRQLIGADGNILEYKQRAIPRGNVLNHIFIDNFVCFSSSVVRKICFEKVGIFDESLRLGIDFDRWIRMSARYKFDHCDDILVQYRVGHGQLSDFKVERVHTAFKIMDSCLRDVKVKKGLALSAKLAAYSMTYNTLGCGQLDAGKCWQARTNFLKSLWCWPFQFDAVKFLAKSFIPKPMLRMLRDLHKRVTAC